MLTVLPLPWTHKTFSSSRQAITVHVWGSALGSDMFPGCRQLSDRDVRGALIQRLPAALQERQVALQHLKTFDKAFSCVSALNNLLKTSSSFRTARTTRSFCSRACLLAATRFALGCNNPACAPPNRSGWMSAPSRLAPKMTRSRCWMRRRSHRKGSSSCRCQRRALTPPRCKADPENCSCSVNGHGCSCYLEFLGLVSCELKVDRSCLHGRTSTAGLPCRNKLRHPGDGGQSRQAAAGGRWLRTQRLRRSVAARLPPSAATEGLCGVCVGAKPIRYLCCFGAACAGGAHNAQ